MRDLIKLLRPHQYLKNGFIFLGPLFSRQWDLLTLGCVSIAFVAFCAIASAVYILNDMIDIEADRLHPTKCRRPLASGAVTLKAARFLLLGLVIFSIGLAFVVSYLTTLFIVIYFVMNIFYSLRWKHIVILDVFIISTGFMLRILVGTLGVSILPSPWILLCGMMLTLFLGFSKRLAECIVIEKLPAEGATRPVLQEYSAKMLEQFISVTASGTILTYSLYSVALIMSDDRINETFMITIPLVTYGVFRYLYLVQNRGGGDDTARDLLTDVHLIVTVIAWLIITIWILA